MHCKSYPAGGSTGRPIIGQVLGSGGLYIAGSATAGSPSLPSSPATSPPSSLTEQEPGFGPLSPRSRACSGSAGLGVSGADWQHEIFWGGGWDAGSVGLRGRCCRRGAAVRGLG